MDEHLQLQICERIKQARKAAGLTQEDMASLMNVTPRAYQNYERNRVPFRRLGDIARLTGSEQEWLLRGDSAQSEVQAGLLRDVAAGMETLQNSQEDVHQKLDEILNRLEHLGGSGSHSAETQP